MTVCGVFCKESPCADNAAFSKTQRHTEKILYLLSTSVSGTFASLKLNQLNRVVRQRAKPQTTRSTSIAALKATAGPQWSDICGTRAIVAKIRKIPVAVTTKDQSHKLRVGFGSPTICLPAIRAST